jgi:hypothetical protein
VADEHDLAAGAHGVGLRARAEVVATRAAPGRGPDAARDQAEQRALAAAVRADDAPMLAALELPSDVAQHGRAREVDIDVLERDEWGGAHESRLLVRSRASVPELD